MFFPLFCPNLTFKPSVREMIQKLFIHHGVHEIPDKNVALVDRETYKLKGKVVFSLHNLQTMKEKG